MFNTKSIRRKHSYHRQCFLQRGGHPFCSSFSSFLIFSRLAGGSSEFLISSSLIFSRLTGCSSEFLIFSSSFSSSSFFYKIQSRNIYSHNSFKNNCKNIPLLLAKYFCRLQSLKNTMFGATQLDKNCG